MEKLFDYGPRADSNALKLERMYRSPKTKERALIEIKDLKKTAKNGEGSDSMTLTRLFALGIPEADITIQE